MFWQVTVLLQKYHNMPSIVSSFRGRSASLLCLLWCFHSCWYSLSIFTTSSWPNCMASSTGRFPHLHTIGERNRKRSWMFDSLNDIKNKNKRKVRLDLSCTNGSTLQVSMRNFTTSMWPETKCIKDYTFKRGPVKLL